MTYGKPVVAQGKTNVATFLRHGHRAVYRFLDKEPLNKSPWGSDEFWETL